MTTQRCLVNYVLGSFLLIAALLLAPGEHSILLKVLLTASGLSGLVLMATSLFATFFRDDV